jgi:malate dehydrogenase
MAESVIQNQNHIFPCCVRLDGQWGLKDVYMGAPVKLGRNGVEKVIEIDLNKDEMALLEASAGHVREVMAVYDNMKLN